MSNLNLNTNINFFVPKLQNNRRVSLRKNIIIILPALLIIAMGLTFAYMQFTIADLGKESAKLKDYLASPGAAKIKKDYTEKKKISDTLESYGAILDTIEKNLKASNIIGTTIIEKINATLPKDTIFKSYSIADRSVRITGETGSRITSAELLHNLSQSGVFEDVRIGSLTQTAVGSVTTFTLEGTLKGVSDK
jgi:Tfp pilus assembly protein PilN